MGRSLQTNGISVKELNAIVKNINHNYVFNNSHIRNGRIYIHSLQVAQHIFNKPLSKHDIELLLADDLKNVTKEAKSIFGLNWEQISEPRREVIIDTLFNLGLPNFKTFHNFIDAVKAQDWAKAGKELLSSQAAENHFVRYHRNASVIITGNPQYFEIR